MLVVWGWLDTAASANLYNSLCRDSSCQVKISNITPSNKRFCTNWTTLLELHVYIILNLLCTNKIFQFCVGQSTQHVVDNLTHSSLLTSISFIVDLKLGYSFVNHIDPDIPRKYSTYKSKEYCKRKKIIWTSAMWEVTKLVCYKYRKRTA